MSGLQMVLMSREPGCTGSTRVTKHASQIYLLKEFSDDSRLSLRTPHFLALALPPAFVRRTTLPSELLSESSSVGRYVYTASPTIPSTTPTGECVNTVTNSGFFATLLYFFLRSTLPSQPPKAGIPPHSAVHDGPNVAMEVSASGLRRSDQQCVRARTVRNQCGYEL